MISLPLFFFEKSGSRDFGAKVAGGDTHNFLQCSSASADTACSASSPERVTSGWETTGFYTRRLQRVKTILPNNNKDLSRYG